MHIIVEERDVVSFELHSISLDSTWQSVYDEICKQSGYARFTALWNGLRVTPVMSDTIRTILNKVWSTQKRRIDQEVLHLVILTGAFLRQVLEEEEATARSVYATACSRVEALEGTTKKEKETLAQAKITYDTHLRLLTSAMVDLESSRESRNMGFTELTTASNRLQEHREMLTAAGVRLAAEEAARVRERRQRAIDAAKYAALRERGHDT